MANPFETLGLAPTFALTTAELEQRQRELNRTLHPDRHSQKSSGERRLALSRAMDVNQAFRALRDPTSRAEALFELLGLDSLAERTATDPVLLGEMLEQRELLDDVRRNKDAERLRALKLSMQERERDLVTALARAFDPLLPTDEPIAKTTSDDPRVMHTQALLTELRYVRRFTEEVAAIEDEL
jgi:molecular chaperone HscB